MKTPASFYFRLLPPLRALARAICKSFEDILPMDSDFFLQTKKEEWGGAFVDRQSSEEVADQSISRVMMKPRSEVS